MGVALRAGYDLSGLAACYTAIGLLLLAVFLVRAFAAVLDVGVGGFHPFHGVAVRLENAVVGELNGAIRGVEGIAAQFESGLIDSFGFLIGIPLLLGLGVKAALEYLWGHALRPLIHSLTDAIRDLAVKAEAQVVALEGTLAADVSALERYARERASSALSAAEGYVDRALAGAVATLRGDIAAAEHAAERFAEGAVGRLRAAEDTAIAHAGELAAEARAAGIAAAAAAVATLERDLGTAVAQSEAEAARLLGEAEAAGAAALARVRGIAVGAADDLATIEGRLGALGVAGLIAAIPALATMVAALAVEAGLESAECRRKVKGICGTDPRAWEQLLAGAALIGLPLSLAELVAVCKPLIAETAGVMREFA